MKQRGRSSASNVIAINTAVKRIAPPSDLSPTERQSFVDLIATCSPSHFVPSDIPLIVSYIQANAMARRAAKELDAGNPAALKVWATATKLQTSLSIRLRLAPSSRTDPQTVARANLKHRPPSAYDLLEDDDGAA